MNPTQYHPGQLLRVTCNFSVMSNLPNIPDALAQIGDIFFLLDLELAPTSVLDWKWRTTLLSPTGRVWHGLWLENPFVRLWGVLCAEPLETS